MYTFVYVFSSSEDMNTINNRTDIVKTTSASSSFEQVTRKESVTPLQTIQDINEMTDEQGKPTEQAYQIAVNKLNEFMDYTQKNSKFVFHKDLERYYVEVIDAQTQEVVKEVPPKELLDAYYEMQKLVGKMFDSQA